MLERSPGPLIAMLMLALAVTPMVAASPLQDAAPEAALYRIFLRDGSMLVSYGEFAHVADRVVLSIPVGGTDDAPSLHLLTIAASDVEWERTNAYLQAARARRYADTRGEIDFATLSREVANTLNEITFVTDPGKRLALAEAARRQLIEWPEQHHGYRADEITQMLSWLDQVVSEFRVAAGQSSFDLSLIARTMPVVPDVQLLPQPTLRERVEFGLIAARRTPHAAERVSLLGAVLDALPVERPEGSWMTGVHARASAELAFELRMDRMYAKLTDRTLARTEPHVRRADVRGLESLVRSVLKEDERLKHARPAAVAALLATLDTHIDAARRLRLARDAWVLRTALLKDYWRDVRQGLDRLLGLRTWLIDVRQLSGPAPRSVRRLADAAAQAQRDLTRVQPPAEAASPHQTLLTVSGLAARAASARLEALRTGQMDIAWQAASAASGALMLLDQAIGELRRITNAPAPASMTSEAAGATPASNRK
jgi:hypothetical protein